MLEANDHPCLTIGITTFDRVDLLIETIESVRNQVFTDFKVLIANDNPDRKLDKKAIGIENDDRFVVINHDLNLGEIETLNTLLDLAETEYFTWLSDDDLIHPLFFQEALAALDRSHLSVAFYSSYSTGLMWEPDLEEIEISSTLRTIDKFSFLSSYASREIQLIGCYGIFRRSAILAAGGFLRLGSGFAPYSDTLIPILLSAHGDLVFSKNNFVFLRTHEDSVSNSSGELRSYTSAQRDFIKVVNLFAENFPKKQRARIFCDFFTWFSSDRAAVICRNPGFIRPLFLQIRCDIASLKSLDVLLFDKIRILPWLLSRLILSARTLGKAKILGSRA